jgi:periplasmic protein TonB
LLAVFIIGNLPVTPPSTEPVDDKPSDIVWVNVPGPGRRSRDAGDRKPAPPWRAERPRRDMVTLPAATPPILAQEPLKDVPNSDTEINIQAVNTSAGVVDLPGALTGLPAVSSQDNEVGVGAGMGTGGRGSGLGNGYDGGIGNGAFGRGGGVTMPSLLTEVKPTYTAEAMRAKVQGAVMVEAIVREDGSVGQVRIVRSLDRTFGLDQEALKAVKNWRFRPGKRQGQNVAVIVEIEVTFTLR